MLVVIMALMAGMLLSGCGPIFQPGPVDYEEANQVYLEQWLAGLRWAVIEGCTQQPDPAACEAAWRAAVQAVGE